MTGTLRFCCWLGLGFLLGVLATGVEGEELIKETSLGTGGSLIGGVLHVFIGGQRRGLRSWMLAPLVGAIALLMAEGLTEALKQPLFPPNVSGATGKLGDME